MKKNTLFILAMAMSFALVGCGAKTEEAPAQTAVETEVTAAEEAAPEEEAEAPAEEKKALPVAQTEEVPAEGEEGHYKATMKPFEELVPGRRLVILQSSLVYSRDGFYTEDTAPQSETISFNGSDMTAYAMSYATAFLNEAPAGNVTVYDAEGNTTDVAADDFAAMYVIIDDFQSGNPATLYNPASGTTVENFDCAVMENGEGIVSMITEQERNVTELLTAYGWDTTLTYHLIASDKFYIPITPEDYDEGGIRGSLSGSINASFPDMTIAMGKMNDVLYIEEVKE